MRPPRIKTQWHRSGAARTPAQLATVVASAAWRLADHAVTHMQQERYTVASQPQAFALIGEFLAFLLQLVDRMAFSLVNDDVRAEFVQAAAKRLIELMEENQIERIGPAADYRQRFVDLLNRRLADYATFDYAETPDWPCLNYFGNAVREHVCDQDKSWVVDQIIEVESPGAMRTIQKTMRDLFPPATEES